MAVIERLSKDLRAAFPGFRGLSGANLWRMRSLYLAYQQEDTILAQPVREFSQAEAPPEIVAIPWGHNIVLLQRLKDPVERLWYARQTLEHGWSRAVLTHQIDSDLYHRQGQAVTNFESTLPPPDSDLAKRLLKDPYAFEFLDVAEQMSERKLEASLIARVQRLLIELRRFVVIDLKTGKFKLEYVGKMGFYLTAVDRQMRHTQDAPSIGLILYRERNRLIVEYTLEDVTRPMGFATYQTLPEEVQRRLPSPELLAAELSVDR